VKDNGDVVVQDVVLIRDPSPNKKPVAAYAVAIAASIGVCVA